MVSVGRFLVAMVLGAAVGGAGAAENESAKPADVPVKASGATPTTTTSTTSVTVTDTGPRNRATFGLSGFFFNYNEELTAPLKSSETGVLGGFALGAERRYEDHGFEVFLNYFAGNSAYVGTTQKGAPATATTQNSMLDIGALVTWELFAEPGNALWELYTGVIRRDWYRGGQYLEIYLWYTSPVGVRYYKDLDPTFRLGFDLAINVMYGGSIDVYLSQYDPNTYGNSYGLLGFRFGSKVAFTAEFLRQTSFPIRVAPWLEYVGFGQGANFAVNDPNGNATGGAFEPASTSLRYGLLVQSGFEF